MPRPVTSFDRLAMRKRVFGCAVNITGQQQALTLGLHLQNAGLRVAADSVRPLPEFERDTVPGPAFATDARLGAEQRRQTLGFPAHHALDRQALGYRRRAAGMIGVGMAEHHQINVFHAQFAQRRDYHPFTEIHKDNVPWHMLFGMDGGMVTHTVVGGRVLMADRKLLTLDEAEIAAKGKEVSGRAWKKFWEICAAEGDK